MKTIHDHRTRARNHFDTPIFWIDKRTQKKHKGRICNISEKGLYVESNHAHQGGANIPPYWFLQQTEYLTGKWYGILLIFF